jgi:hypothetical protein
MDFPASVLICLYATHGDVNHAWISRQGQGQLPIASRNGNPKKEDKKKNDFTNSSGRLSYDFNFVAHDLLVHRLRLCSQILRPWRLHRAFTSASTESHRHLAASPSTASTHPRRLRLVMLGGWLSRTQHRSGARHHLASVCESSRS